MSGARMLVALMSALKNNKSKYGVASLCNGGGIIFFFFYINFEVILKVGQLLCLSKICKIKRK